MKKLILAITLSLAISTNAHSFCFEMCTGTSGSGASSLAELSDWPAAVSATEVGYLDGLTDTLINLLAAKSATTHNHDATYLGIAAKAADADTLDSHDTSYFQTAISFGANVQNALGIAIGSAGAPVLYNGALGTPSSGVGTNLTGTASGLTAGLAAGLTGTPAITVGVVTNNGILSVCLAAAPGTPSNGQLVCADGDNWQPGGATQGTNDWLVRYKSDGTTWIGIYDLTAGTDIVSSAVAAKLNRYHQTAHVNPDVVYTNNAGIVVLDTKTAAALTITEIYVALDEDPTTELTITCYHKTAAIAYTGGTQVDANDTANGTFTANSNFDDATIPAGSKLWCVIGDDPDATNTDLEISITGTYD